MNAFHDAAVMLINGAWSVAGHLMAPWAWCLLLSCASAAWLAQIEVDESDRRSMKPLIGRH